MFIVGLVSSLSTSNLFCDQAYHWVFVELIGLVRFERAMH